MSFPNCCPHLLSINNLSSYNVSFEIRYFFSSKDKVPSQYDLLFFISFVVRSAYAITSIPGLTSFTAELGSTVDGAFEVEQFKISFVLSDFRILSNASSELGMKLQESLYNFKFGSKLNGKQGGWISV